LARLLHRALLRHWPAPERNALIGATLALFGSFLLNATWSVVVLPIQRAFELGVEGEVLLRQLPDIAGLLAVPLVGALGTGISAFRLALTAAVCMCVGAIVMTFAPSLVWLVGGMSLVSVGRTMVGVLAFAVVSASITDEGRRTSGFATLGAVTPTAYIISPVVAGALLDMGGWRWVGAVWICGAVVLALGTGWLRDLSSSAAQAGRKEPWTPILAGITLVGLVQAIGAIALHGVLSGLALVWIGGTVAAASAWFVLVHLLPNPSLDGTTLRTPGLLPMLVVALVAQCGDLWFYVGAVARFVRGLSSFQISLALLVAQFAALGGACLAGWLIRRVGLRATGTALIGLFAASMFVSCVQSTTLPLVVTVAILGVSAVAELGSGVCLSKAIMTLSPKGLDRHVASYRSAATGVGNALALLLVASTVSHVMGASMRQHAEAARPGDPERIEALVRAVQDNVPNGTIGRQLGLSPDRVAELREVRREVIVDGFRAHGLVSGSVLAIAAVGFWLVCRPAPTVTAPTHQT
jgi:MFS family permease